MTIKINLQAFLDASLKASYIATIFSLFVLLFGMPRGHNYVESTVILAISLGFIKYIFTREFNKVNFQIIATCILYGLMLIFSAIIHGDLIRLSKIFFYIPLFLIFAPEIKHSQRLISLSTVAGSLYLFYIIICQYISGISRPYAYTNAILLSQAVFIFLLFNIYFFYKEKNNLFKIVYLISTLLSITIILLTQSRGVWLALILLLGIFIVRKSFRKPIKNLVLAIITTITFTLLYSYNPIVNKKINHAISDLEKIQDNQYNTSWGLRVLAWKSASIDIKDNYLVGVGLDNFQKNKVTQVENEKISPLIVGANLYHTHNQYIQNLLIRGVFGIFALILILTSTLSIKSTNKEGIYLLNSIGFSYAIFGISDVPFEYLNTSFLFLLSISLAYFYLVNVENKTLAEL